MDNNTFQIEQTQFSVVEKIHVDDFLILQSQLGLVDQDSLRSFLAGFSVDSKTEYKIQPIKDAGLGKMYSIEGNLVKARSHFIKSEDNAFEQFAKSKSDIDNFYSYINYESGAFDLKIGEKKSAIKKFKIASNLSDNLILQQLIEYQLIKIKINSDSIYDPDLIIHHINKFNNDNMQIMYVLGLNHLGIHHRKFKEFNKAEECYKNGLSIAVENMYGYLISVLQLSIADCYFLKNEISTSIKKYEDLLETVSSYYLKSKALEGLALISYRQKEYEKAEDYCLKALYNSTQHQVFSQIPGEYVFLGDLYSKNLNEPDKALHFYKLGYDTSISQVQDGLTLKGDLLRANTRYPEFLASKNVAVSASKPKEKKEVFFKQFEGKPWTEIKELFHFNLIIHHRLKSHKFENFLKGVGLIKATYYSHHLKLKGKGFEFPDLRLRVKEIPSKSYVQSIQDYIDKIDDKKWYPANKKFDEDIMMHLYKVYGYKKTKLAKGLHLSYQAVRNKTDQFIERTRD